MARFMCLRLGIRWVIVICLPYRIRLVTNDYTFYIIARSSSRVIASVLSCVIASSNVAAVVIFSGFVLMIAFIYGS
jgi:hypothetical protein